ncbi:MAG: HEAT repeat domain-containing protein [Myxococcaceae bacterium]|nr:HEAT repeat domain-containing protein [Myxococcaceae bacterium]
MKRILVTVCLAVAVLVAAGVLWGAGAESSAVASRVQRWQPGVTRVYALDWQQQQTSAMPTGEGMLAGGLALEADVSLTPGDGDATRTGVLLKVERLWRFDSEVLGQKLPAEGLEGAEALVMVEENGSIESVRFAESDGALNRYLLQALAAELFPRLPGDAPLSYTERLPAGDVESVAHWADDARSTLARTRTHFTQLRLAIGAPKDIRVESHATFRFSGEGPLESVDLRENVEAGDAAGKPLLRMTHSLTLRSKETRKASVVAARPTDKPVVRTPGPLAQEIDVKRALLESRAGGITFEDVLQTLESTDDPKKLANRAQFVWQAAGYLELHPEKCRELVPAFARLSSDPMRAQLVDLLVSAGHAEAQAALRAIMSQDVAKQDPRVFEELYQRLGLVAQPTREAVQFVLDEHAAALAAKDGAQRRVRAFTLGSMANRMRGKDSALATLAGDVLLDDLQLAIDARDQELALRALGNAGDPRTTDAVRDVLASNDDSLRAAAAIALRRVTTPEATALLLERLGHESSAEGQAALFDALRHRALTDEQQLGLRDLLVERRLAPGAERTLMALLNDAKTASPAVVQSLQAVLMNPSVPAAYRVQARALLNRLTL